MKIENDEVDNYKVYLDGELYPLEKRIILSVDTNTGIITYIFKNEHFPYWPSTEYGKITLEKISNG